MKIVGGEECVEHFSPLPSALGGEVAWAVQQREGGGVGIDHLKPTHPPTHH